MLDEEAVSMLLKTTDDLISEIYITYKFYNISTKNMIH